MKSRKNSQPTLGAPDREAASHKTNFAIVLITFGLLLTAVLLFLATQSQAFRSVFRNPDIDAPARFVGSETCATCHRQETEAWRGSHHAKAMAHATDKTVLGDFNNALLDYFGIRSRMFRDGQRFMIETDGPDGKLATFEIKYTFGIDPLQQYLVEFPDGRVQALSVSWDSRPKERGGQKWFHLYPDEKVDHTDVLHWTKLNQNWNFMCAECHSTGVRKNYDPAANRFQTSFAEISVGCEGCHGQGSRHAAWAQSQKSFHVFAKPQDHTFGLLVRYAERLNVTWPIDEMSGSAKRSAQPAALRTEVESCGMCHARRGQLSEEWVPGRWLSHTHAISPLTPGLYDSSGQMHDEVFNYGSFKQSKMFDKGVTCSDCHEPHSGKLRIPGDGVCLQCHATEKFSAATHHRHEVASPPVTCVNCHMPVRTYMVVDDRHDHSFRVPRPDQSMTTGASNACNDCHKDKNANWAANAIESWYGAQRKGFQNYTSAFAISRANQPEAARLLIATVNERSAPSIARATALSGLSAHPSPETTSAIRSVISNADPMVRIAALDALESAPQQQLWPIAGPLLSDPIRGVRIRAALLLASISPATRPASDRRAFERAADEFIATQKLNADRPESRTGLGTFYRRQGRIAEAEVEYKAAITLSSQFAPAFVNLADLYRYTNRDIEAISILRQGIKDSPGNAALLHSLGLALVRQKDQLEEAIPILEQAALLARENARYGYVYGVALNSTGRSSDAAAALRAVLADHPGDRDTLAALITYEQEAGDLSAALRYTERLSAITPTDASLRRLADDLRRRIQLQR
jgi:predicted CXXCH cytochrome family protein